jgi:hypothetical protein
MWSLHHVPIELEPGISWTGNNVDDHDYDYRFFSVERFATWPIKLEKPYIYEIPPEQYSMDHYGKILEHIGDIYILVAYGRYGCMTLLAIDTRRKIIICYSIGTYDSPEVKDVCLENEELVIYCEAWPDNEHNSDCESTCDYDHQCTDARIDYGKKRQQLLAFFDTVDS